MKRLIFLLIVLSVSHAGTAQTRSGQIDKFYDDLRREFKQDEAFKTVAFVESRWRLAGNTGFNESIFFVEKVLQKAGFLKEVKGESGAVMTYRIEKRKMKNPTWEPVSASLVINNEKIPLLEFKGNRNMLPINCPSTPQDGISGEIIDVGQGRREDFEGKDVKGKIVFGETNIASLYKNATDRGAIGVLAYSLPAYLQPSKHPTSIQFQRIGAKDSDTAFGILLSFEAKEKLKVALAKGAVKATARIVTKRYDSEELTLVANIRGSSRANERFVFSAHVQEPGANDNASGVGTLAEMARTAAALVTQKKFAPARTITFLWGDEIVSTNRYINDEPERAKGIKWGLSLDMVGEDVSKTGGTFLIEKMPDPSAIWTRGNDKHTEWGGSVLRESQLFPHYFNDLLLNRCYQQAKESGWVVNANPFEGGSDHTPFLDAKIPGLLMWHFTDVYYHTDGDRLANVSPQEMRNVGITALATSFCLVSPTEEILVSLVEEVKASALTRLQTEFDLSKSAVAQGRDVRDEERILEVWTNYYRDAIAALSDIPLGTPSSAFTDKVNAAKAEIVQKGGLFKTMLTR